jgi:hypothetical protein
MNTLLGDFIKQRNKTIIKDYKKLKKEVAEDFKNTIKQFRKRHPYIKYIEFRDSNIWRSRGIIYMGDTLDIAVKEEDIEIK